MTHNCCASCRPVTDRKPRALVLTGLAYGLLDADERVTPDRLFDDQQLAAIEKAGYTVTFVRAERLLGMAS